jgi:acyl-coenzyme A thioesterase PaaI-like protein
MATLDLRIDYMEPAIPHLDVLVRSECFKLTRNIAFVKGVAYQKDVNDPIATSMATFMLGTPNTPREQEIRSSL